MADTLRLQEAERIELEDMRFLAATPLEAAKQLAASLVSQTGVTTNGAARAAPVILSGFKPVLNNGPAREVRIDRGVAVLGMREAGSVSHGALTTEGDAQRIVTITSPSAGTYGIYIRFEQTDAGFANRVFWDADAPGEYAQNIATRRISNWGMALSLINQPNQSPGGAEWLKVGEATVAGGVLTVVTPQRPLLFEGAEAATFASQWGSGNDRNANRDLYGLKDLRMFAQAALKKIEELQSGTARWWTATAEPLDQKVSKNGDSMNGNYTFLGGGNSVTIDGELTTVGFINAEGGLRNGSPQDIGTNASPFGKAYLTDIQVKDAAPDVLVQATGAQASFTLQNSATPAEKGYLLYNITGSNYLALGSDASLFLMPNGTTLSNYPMALDNTSVQPAVDDTIKLGTSTNRWQEVHAHDVKPHTRLEMATGKVVDHLLPLTNGTYDLGNNTVNFWRDLWAQGVNISNLKDTDPSNAGTITVFTGILRPNVSGTDLGTTGARWDMFGNTGNFASHMSLAAELQFTGASSAIRAAQTTGLVVAPPAAGTGSVPDQGLLIDLSTGGAGATDKPAFGISVGAGGTAIEDNNSEPSGQKTGAIKIRLNHPTLSGDKYIWIYDVPG